MSEKTLVWLGLTLVALLVIWGGVGLVSSLGGGSPEAEGELAAALEGISEASVDRVVLTGPSDTVTLEKSGTRWTANGFESDSAAVAGLWSALSETTVRELVATNPSNHARLGVRADGAWALEAHPGDGDPVRILLGDQGGGFNTAYARLPTGDEVYLLEGGLRGAVAHDIDHWRDKVIVAVDTARIQRVELERDGESYALTRDSASWRVDGREADDPTARSLVGALARLEAQGFAPDTADFEAGEERRRVVALDEGGDTLAVVELASTSGSAYLARTPSREWLFEIPSWRAGRLTPERADLVRSEGAGGG